MKKVPAVTQVKVSLNDGLTVLDLKPGNTVTLAELRQIIKNNGFVSKEATFIAHGSVSADGKSFTVDGTNERLGITAAPQRSGDGGGEWRVIVPAPQPQGREGEAGGGSVLPQVNVWPLVFTVARLPQNVVDGSGVDPDVRRSEPQTMAAFQKIALPQTMSLSGVTSAAQEVSVPHGTPSPQATRF